VTSGIHKIMLTVNRQTCRHFMIGFGNSYDGYVHTYTQRFSIMCQNYNRS